MHNPVIQHVLELLRQSPDGLTEYAIHRALGDHAAFKSLADGSQLSLFRKHFLVMNALYQLQQQQWTESRCVLSISPLHIQLDAASDHSRSDLLAEQAASSAYYLDWDNYRQTGEADVASLIDGFWQRYHRQDTRLEAIKTLQLDADATQKQIERQYRRLAALHHPDRGGDQETFITIRSAYEQLR